MEEQDGEEALELATVWVGLGFKTSGASIRGFELPSLGSYHDLQL